MEVYYVNSRHIALKMEFELFKRVVLAIDMPEKIILFGSQARGTANEDSDVDILVMMEFEGRGMRKSAEIRSSIPHRFPLDLLVRRPDDVAWRISQNDFFLQDVMKEGKILYESTHSAMVG